MPSNPPLRDAREVAAEIRERWLRDEIEDSVKLAAAIESALREREEQARQDEQRFVLDWWFASTTINEVDMRTALLVDHYYDDDGSHRNSVEESLKAKRAAAIRAREGRSDG